MIYCDQAKLADYLGLCEELDIAIRHILTMDGSKLAMGRNDVDGERVFINRFDYQTAPEETLLYESHIRYADIHLLLSGEEYILVAEEAGLNETERDETADYVGLDGGSEARVDMKPGKVLIVFPHEAHKVKCRKNQSSHVQKIVVKVRMAQG